MSFLGCLALACFVSMICMTRNYQGASTREVLRTLKEIIKTHKPHILGILEPRIFGFKVDEVCNKLGLDEWVKVEAIGFSGDIWVI